MNTSATRSLSEGNRLQRAYYRWAEPYYQRMAPDLRAQSMAIDSFLYSRRGLGFWLGLLGAVIGSSFGLVRAGMPAWLSIGLSLLLWLFVPLGLLAAWLQPARFSGRDLRGRLPHVVALAFLGAFLGFTAGHVAKRGRLDPGQLLLTLWDAMSVLAPAVVLVAVAMLGLVWGVAKVRRQVLERALTQARLEQERDASARQAAQAQLKLLQGQIQPHFIFNTLSAVQHWVDTGDARGGPLLRTLTAFLRGSTEALGKEDISVAEEVELVRHYLGVMQARLGQRLSFSLDVQPAAAPLKLPPGLLLTLVENAIEHGISGSLQGGDVAVLAQCQDGWLTIDISDSAGRLAVAVEEGVGLGNCRERLRHLYGPTARLDLAVHQGRTLARLQLPLHDAPNPR